MDNTVIILTTDHGTHNGQHGRTGKNWILYEEITHIPLIVWHPELAHAARVKQFVQPIDFLPTVLDAAGLPAAEGVHGQSILPLLADPEGAPGRDAIIFGEFHQATYITDGEYWLEQGVDPSNPSLYSYSQNMSKWSSDDWGPFDGTRRLVGPKNSNTAGERNATRLYHLTSDPGQERELAAQEPEQVRRLQKLLIDKLQALDAPEELLTRFGLDKV